MLIKQKVPYEFSSKYFYKFVESKKAPRNDILARLVFKGHLYEDYSKFYEWIKNRSKVILDDGRYSRNETEALLHCYNGETAPLRAIKAHIKTAQCASYRAVCPYCGKTGSDWYDHFFPKEKFPSLAVHPLNLTCICSTCNIKKGEKDPDIFFHPYFDNPSCREVVFSNFWILPEHEFPTITVVLRNVIHRVGKKPRRNTLRLQLLEKTIIHYDELDIISNYSNRAAADAASIIQPLLGLSMRDISAELIKSAREEAKSFGPNNIKSVLALGMIRCRALLLRISLRNISL